MCHNQLLWRGLASLVCVSVCICYFIFWLGISILSLPFSSSSSFSLGSLNTLGSSCKYLPMYLSRALSLSPSPSLHRWLRLSNPGFLLFELRWGYCSPSLFISLTHTFTHTDRQTQQAVVGAWARLWWQNTTTMYTQLQQHMVQQEEEEGEGLSSFSNRFNQSKPTRAREEEEKTGMSHAIWSPDFGIDHAWLWDCQVNTDERLT